MYVWRRRSDRMGQYPPTRKVGLAPAVNRATFSLHTDNRG
nr:MAG TPA: hypothetical protein [Caudoviricetes sp.]